MAEKIVGFDTKRGEELRTEAAEITGLDNPNSLAQLKPWIQSHGLPAESLRKDDVEDLLTDPDLPADVRRVLEIRQALGKTSVKKYQTMIDIAGHDDGARGIMQFYGGHTGRWAGRSL
jgi:DNA polymerase